LRRLAQLLKFAGRAAGKLVKRLNGFEVGAIRGVGTEQVMSDGKERHDDLLRDIRVCSPLGRLLAITVRHTRVTASWSIRG